MVAERRSASFYRVGKRKLDGVDQTLEPCDRNFARRASGMYAGTKQGFGRINIANTNHNTAVHDELLDANTAALRDSVQICSIKARGQWLWPKRVEKRMRRLRSRDPKHRAETPGVRIADDGPVVERDIQVIMYLRRMAAVTFVNQA